MSAKYKFAVLTYDEAPDNSGDMAVFVSFFNSRRVGGDESDFQWRHAVMDGCTFVGRVFPPTVAGVAMAKSYALDYAEQIGRGGDIQGVWS